VAAVTPVELVLEKLEEKGCRGRGTSWQCPAHEDRRPSLSVREGQDGRVLLHCFAGCSFNSIVDALDLRIAQLFTVGSRRSQ